MPGKILYEELTHKIRGCFYRVYNALGGGFLESVYENALMIELEEMGLAAENQKVLEVYYRKRLVGEFKADIVVENKVIVELKAVSELADHHRAQLLNYLKTTGLRVGLLVNFGPEIKVSRLIF